MSHEHALRPTSRSTLRRGCAAAASRRCLGWLARSCVALLNLVIGGQCDGKCVTDTLAQTLRVATPIALAAFCGVMCERAGVVNIGIEGKMLTAAMVGYR